MDLNVPLPPVLDILPPQLSEPFKKVSDKSNEAITVEEELQKKL